MDGVGSVATRQQGPRIMRVQNHRESFAGEALMVDDVGSESGSRPSTSSAWTLHGCCPRRKKDARIRLGHIAEAQTPTSVSCGYDDPTDTAVSNAIQDQAADHSERTSEMWMPTSEGVRCRPPSLIPSTALSPPESKGHVVYPGLAASRDRIRECQAPYRHVESTRAG